MKALLSFGLSIVLLTGSAVAQARESDVETNGTSFLMTVEYWGPETRNTYRVGLATPDKAGELGQWRAANWLMREYFLTNSIAATEAAKLREVLAQAPLQGARTKVRPKEHGQYVITVTDHQNKYDVPIGFDLGTREVVLSLQGACQSDAAALLERIVLRLPAASLGKGKREVDKK